MAAASAFRLFGGFLLHRLGATVLLCNRRHGVFDIPLEFFVTYRQTGAVKCFDELNGTRLQLSSISCQIDKKKKRKRIHTNDDR